MQKKVKQLLAKYNRPGNIAVVSSYPEKGVKYSGKVCAVGGFAKNTLESLKKEYRMQGETKKFIVLTVMTKGREEVYEEKGVLVIQCIDRDKPLSYMGLLRMLRELGQIKTIMVEFEFASFGGVIMSLGILGVMGILRVMGKRVILVLHQVVFDLNQLSGHVGFGKNSFKVLFFQTGLKLFYRMLGLVPEKIIVLEKEFKNRLSQLVDAEKITIIPHGVDSGLKAINKSAARKKLGISLNKKVILYFGYLTWYKGVDWLINQQLTTDNLQLTIAGGESFTQKEKPHYKQFISYVYSRAKEKNIKITGFLSEKKINLYFSAADLVVLPYRTFMSSSGPLSMALGFGKPFIISQPMEKILETEDFIQGLKESGLKKSDLVFNLTKKSFKRKLDNFGELGRLGMLSRRMRQKRSFENLAGKYINILEKKELSIGIVKGKTLPAFRFLKA